MSNTDDKNTQESPQGHRHFPVQIDDDHFQLTQPLVSVASLLDLVGKQSCRYALYKGVPHPQDQPLNPNVQIDLSLPGANKFVTKEKSEVTIYIMDDPFSIQRGSHTVAEILELVHLAPPGYDLYQITNKLSPLPANLPVQIDGCERFTYQVSSGGSS